MSRVTCEPIQELPDFQEPVSFVSLSVYRDGGSTEVVLADANEQLLQLYFDYCMGRSTEGRLYLKANSTPCMHPIAQDSQAERDATRLLRQHLDRNYSVEELQQLAALDGSRGFRNICDHDYQGYHLLRCLERVEELRKLALFGIIARV